MNQWFRKKIEEVIGSADFDVSVPPDTAMGDYSTNAAFLLAHRSLGEGGGKKEKKNPREIAERLCKELMTSNPDVLEKCEVAGAGYINFFLRQGFLEKELEKYHTGAMTPSADRGKVIVEYSSPNIAKQMHVGHLRSTIIGDALANVYEALGHEVVRWNYPGDWGTQFGKLAVAYRKWGSEGLGDSPVAEMERLYVKFHQEAEKDPLLEAQAREEFRKLESGDEDSRKLWWQFRQDSLEYLERNIYEKLGIRFQIIKGESSYEDGLEQIQELLDQNGLLKESEGAQIVELEGMAPALIRKSDGASLYITRDLASLQDRLENYKPAKILYVVANQQALNFQQLFALADKLGWNQTELVHVKYGLVLGSDGKKFSTREGNAVPLSEAMEKIIDLAKTVVLTKNPELSKEESDEIGRVVGLGALKYNDLKQHPHTDIVFDWDSMLDLSGNSGPYLQYTYARMRNIILKAGSGKWPTKLPMGIDPEGNLIERKLIHYIDVLDECVKGSALTGLALYLYELAGLLSRFYENVRVLDEPDAEKKSARLRLLDVATKNLKSGLEILGIETLERI